ncbi:MAG: T9SS type A sorting domain-containing protein [Bacteroidetes bacterium]|nr:T9SS type A sorting domain-containing protein [Bacteroidota bacterium]
MIYLSAMKKLTLVFLLTALLTEAKAQFSDSLFTISQHNSYSVLKCGILNTQSKTYFIGNDIPSNAIYSGLYCYDMNNNRVFHASPTTIFIFDPNTRKVIDTIASSISVQSLEFDQINNKLIAFHRNQLTMEILAVDPSTKTIQLLSTQNTITQTQGKSTMDLLNSIIYIKTNLGITAIDATNGAILKNIPDTKNIQAMEFHSISKKLYGLYWDGKQEVLTEVDPQSNKYNDIGVLNGVDWITSLHTLNIGESRMAILTNLGVTLIHLPNAKIVDTIGVQSFKNMDVFSALEYLNSASIISNYKGSKSGNTGYAYPNPANKSLKIGGIATGVNYDLVNYQGIVCKKGIVDEDGLDVSTLPSGIYFIRFEGGCLIRFTKTDTN